MTRADFHGEETLVLESEHLRLEVLTGAGPRIVRLELAGSGEEPTRDVADVGWEHAVGEYHLRGGHRLWYAPENPPLTFPPDEGDLLVTESAHGFAWKGSSRSRACASRWRSSSPRAPRR